MDKKDNPAAARRPVAISGAAGQKRVDLWQIAAEVPVSLCYNGVAHAIMMASPSDLEDFALGFSLSERILEGKADLEDLEVQEVERGYLIDMRVTEAANARVASRRRNLPGQTSCGICGGDRTRRGLAETAAPRGETDSIGCSREEGCTLTETASAA